jgi:hypothetical protein
MPATSAGMTELFEHPAAARRNMHGCGEFEIPIISQPVLVGISFPARQSDNRSEAIGS